MRGKATWLILIAVGAVVTAGLVDAVRGSSSNPEAAQDGLSVTEPSNTMATMALPAQTTEAVTTTEPLATTEPVDATVTAIESTASKRLPSGTGLTLRHWVGNAVLTLAASCEVFLSGRSCLFSLVEGPPLHPVGAVANLPESVWCWPETHAGH
jgi:hypothetical protein